MVAALGETTAGPVLPHLLDNMLASEEGRRILRERPRINTNTIDMTTLAGLPQNTFGHTYVAWLERCGVTPDTREPVRYIHTAPPLIPNPAFTGALHRRPRTRLCHAAIPRMPRFLPCALWPARLCRVRACTEGLRIRKPRLAVRSAIYRSRRTPERYQTRTFLRGVFALGTALWQRCAEYDHGILGGAVGAGPGGAEGGAWCVGPSSAKVEKAALGGQGSSSTEGGGSLSRSSQQQADLLRTCVPVFYYYSAPRHCLFRIALMHTRKHRLR